MEEGGQPLRPTLCPLVLPVALASFSPCTLAPLRPTLLGSVAVQVPLAPLSLPFPCFSFFPLSLRPEDHLQDWLTMADSDLTASQPRPS